MNFEEFKNTVEKKKLSMENAKERTKQFLYTAVNQEKNEANRKYIIDLKRNIDKISYEKLDKYKQININHPNYQQYIEDLHDILEYRNFDFSKEYKIILDKHLQDNREAVLQSFECEYFKNGVAMSNRNILKNYYKYVVNNNNKKSRMTQQSIKNYYNRMNLKPSPFSTFTTIEINIEDYIVSDNKHSYEVYSEYNETYYKIIELSLLELDALDNIKKIKLNSSISKTKDNYHYINVEMTPKYMYYKEKEMILKENITINECIHIIKKECFNYSKSMKSIEKNLGSKGVNTFLYLLKNNFLYLSFGIDDYEKDKINKLSDMIKTTQTQDLTIIKVIQNLDKLSHLLNQINNKPFTYKEALVENIYLHTIDLLNLIGKQDIINTIESGSIIYQNNIDTQITFPKEKLEVSFETVDIIHSIFRLFDDNIIEKIFMKKFFEKNYNNTVKFKDFSKHFNSVYNEKNWEMIKKTTELQTIKKLREEFFTYIKNKKINSKDINLDTQWLKKFISTFPDYLDCWESFSMYFQYNKEDNYYILNDIGPGMGRHILRYTRNLDNKNLKFFTDTYKKNISEIENSKKKKYADISSTLSLNINLKSCSLNTQINYPTNNNKNNYNISDLFVTQKNGVLILVDEKGTEIDVTPTGFLFPALAPETYKMLCRFSFSNGVQVNLWDRYSSFIDCNEEHFPNIFINNVLIEREVFNEKASDLQLLLENNTYEMMDLNEYLSNKIGIKEPLEFFSKFTYDIDALINENIIPEDWIKLIKNSKLRKPQYYNLNNYLDFKNFSNIIKSVDSEQYVKIQKVNPRLNDSNEYIYDFYKEGV
nr:hypothetical protein [Macrococcus caseolyticus]